MNSDGEQRFTRDEIEYLLKLIQEYSEKLRIRSESWHQLRARSQAITSLVALIASSVPLVWLFFVRDILDRQPSGSGPILTVTMIVTVVAAVFLASVMLVLRMQNSGRARIEADNIAHLRSVLERIVQRASQIADHSIDDLTFQIAFDLRIAEAEAALHQSAAAAKMGR